MSGLVDGVVTFDAKDMLNLSSPLTIGVNETINKLKADGGNQ